MLSSSVHVIRMTLSIACSSSQLPGHCQEEDLFSEQVGAHSATISMLCVELPL